MPTRANKDHPTRRVVQSRAAGELVVTIRPETLELRPLGRRAAAAVVSIGWGSLYDRLQHNLAIARAAEQRQRRGGRRA